VNESEQFAGIVGQFSENLADAGVLFIAKEKLLRPECRGILFLVVRKRGASRRRVRVRR
jgi:hypothetical protein